MRRTRVIGSLVAAFAVVMAGVIPAVADSAATYTVTITNHTGGQPFTPPLVVSHRPSVDLFEVGQPASEAIKEIAENGNLGPAIAFATDSGAAKHISDAVVAANAPDGPPPVLPGSSRSFTLTSSNGANRVSWASMLICTNDGFTGVDSVRLPKQVGDSISLDTMAYDAGTEINTEDLADIVPPCQALTETPQTDAPGTGVSDPALAEGGVIHPHAGISGDADLSVDVHGWTGPVATITITRDS